MKAATMTQTERKMEAVSRAKEMAEKTGSAYAVWRLSIKDADTGMEREGGPAFMVDRLVPTFTPQPYSLYTLDCLYWAKPQ